MGQTPSLGQKRRLRPRGVLLGVACPDDTASKPAAAARRWLPSRRRPRSDRGRRHRGPGRPGWRGELALHPPLRQPAAVLQPARPCARRCLHHRGRAAAGQPAMVRVRSGTTCGHWLSRPSSSGARVNQGIWEVRSSGRVASSRFRCGGRFPPTTPGWPRPPPSSPTPGCRRRAAGPVPAGGLSRRPGGPRGLLLCSWLADSLAGQGPLEDAVALYESLCDRATPLGLLAEQVDPAARRGVRA
jgi:hypothetical protein